MPPPPACTWGVSHLSFAVGSTNGAVEDRSTAGFIVMVAMAATGLIRR